MRFIFRSILVFCVLNLIACTDTPQAESADGEQANSSTLLDLDDDQNDPVIARNDEDVIRLSDLDEEIRLKKFDLEWALYELRLFALAKKTELSSDQESSSWALMLDPPWPPRIELPTSNRHIIGNENAPVKISVFCSYQSSPCMRVQPVLREIKSIYAELVSFIPFDYPMHFHRYGLDAASAARCGEEQNQFERYQQGLYAAIEQLNETRYFAIAKQLGLDLKNFKACFQTRRYQALIQEDIALAKSLNTGNVPLIFINGLYTKGPKSLDTYTYYIERELMRLGIELEERGASSDPEPDESPAEMTPTDSDLGFDDNGDIETDIDTQTRVLPVSASMTLSREWVDAHLLNQSELEKSFKEAEHIVNQQYHLLRLEDVADTDFYSTLGLHERDVIMTVNGEWLHSGQNTLWDTLHTNDAVSIVLMRKGLPYRYDFNIE